MHNKIYKIQYSLIITKTLIKLHLRNKKTKKWNKVYKNDKKR